MSTKIPYVDETWSPVTGCDPDDGGQSEACTHCYARRMARRLAGRFGYPEAPHHFDVTLHPERLTQPEKWKKARRIFVCSMGDLFHEDVPLDFFTDVLDMVADPRNWVHDFLFLTKRVARMKQMFDDVLYLEYDHVSWDGQGPPSHLLEALEAGPWPLPNLWLGVTAENQQRADERIPVLLETPAAVRFVSVEPMLGLISLGEHLYYYDIADISAQSKTEEGCCTIMQDVSLNAWSKKPGIDWIVCGGETGPSARPMDPDDARSLLGQCRAADVPFFFKKMGGGRPTPDDLMIQEYPET